MSEGTDINITTAPEEHIICQYRYLFEKRFRFQPCVCNGCHDVLMISLDINNIAILNI